MGKRTAGQVPRLIHSIEALPGNASGKVDKQALRQLAIEKKTAD